MQTFVVAVFLVKVTVGIFRTAPPFANKLAVQVLLDFEFISSRARSQGMMESSVNNNPAHFFKTLCDQNWCVRTSLPQSVSF